MPFLSIGQTITTYAGNGVAGYSGDGGPATAAKIGYINGIAIDKFGNLYLGDGNNARIRKVFAATGIITTVAGNGTAGFSGDNGQATAAQINIPTQGDIAIDDAGNLYIADELNLRIRKVNAATGIISTIAGNGVQLHSGDNGPASAASFWSVSTMTVDNKGNIFLNDSGGYLRKISTAGTITAIAGIGTVGYSGDNGPATNAQISLQGLGCDSKGNVYFASPPYIRKVDIISGIITTVAGDGSSTFNNGVTATSTGVGAGFIMFDKADLLYLTEGGSTYSRVRKIDELGKINVVAGTGLNGFSGDGGPASSAKLYSPTGIVCDKSNNIYFADQQNLRIRKITFPTTAVNEKINSLQPSIYPNPTNDILHIDNLQTPATYRLLNMVGAAVQHGGLQKGSNSLAVQQLPAGVYMLEVSGEDGQRNVSKVLKQ